MTVVIIASNIDPASINIKKQLLRQTTWKETEEKFQGNLVYRHILMKDIFLITINDRKITHENLDKEVTQKLDIKPKQMIYISRHTSKTGDPTLTAHPIGNYGTAEYGGKNKTLVKCSPHLMTQLLRNIDKNARDANLYHKVCLEVTHHGPYLETPTLFVEVGSTEKEWKNMAPAEVVAKSLLELLNKYHYEEDFKGDIPILVGIGGGHYTPRFTDVLLEKKVSFGHMIPAYHLSLEYIDDNVFEQALKKTPNVSGVYIHRKSLKKSQITMYKKWFQNRDITVYSSKELPDL